MLAFGQVVFHQPWIGIYLTTALLCGAICWALQAFVSPGWALIGGLFAVFRLALFSYWMNSYWGGSITALGGALALGAVLRLFAPERTERNRALLACLFGLSLLLLGTSRPYEGLAFSLPLLAYFAYKLVVGMSRREIRLSSTALPVITIGMAGLLLMGYYNKTTTGNPLLMPYALYERTYAELPLFFGQGPAHQVSSHDPVFTKYYQVEATEHGYRPDASASDIVDVELHRLGQNWFFYVGPALTFPLLIGFLLCVKRRDLLLVLATFLTTGAAVASCIFAQIHYFAPATVAVYVFAVCGLSYLWDQHTEGARAFVIAVCLTVFVTALTRTTGAATMSDPYGYSDTRQQVARQLANAAGKTAGAGLLRFRSSLPRQRAGPQRRRLPNAEDSLGALQGRGQRFRPVPGLLRPHLLVARNRRHKLLPEAARPLPRPIGRSLARACAVGDSWELCVCAARTAATST